MDTNTPAFELDGPTANREAILSQHAALKELISQSDLPLVFSKVLGEAIPSNPTANDASVVLGAFIDFALSMIATTAHIMGLLPAHRQTVADAIAEFAKKEFPNMVALLASVPNDILSTVQELDENDPELKAKLDALVQKFRDEHGKGVIDDKDPA